MRARRLGAFAAAGLGLAVAGAAAQGPRDTACEAVNGTIVPACNGVICNEGTITGDLRGRFSTRRTSIYPAGSGWLYTAWLKIDVEGGKGVVEMLDEGVAPRDAEGGPDLAKGTEVLTLSEAGTGAYREHTAVIVTSGAYSAGRPTPYTGRLCHKTSGR